MNTKTDTFSPQVGDFVSYTMVTDTRTYRVEKVTAKTLTLRPCKSGEVVKSENRDGNPFPCVWREAVPVEGAQTKVVRRRKDGTFRAYNGGKPFRMATMIDGKPVEYTDYRM